MTRCYTKKQLLEMLSMASSTFNELKRRGELPMVEELKPRIGRRCRYRADLVDRYLENQLGQPRAFRRSA